MTGLYQVFCQAQPMYKEEHKYIFSRLHKKGFSCDSILGIFKRSCFNKFDAIVFNFAKKKKNMNIEFSIENKA